MEMAPRRWVSWWAKRGKPGPNTPSRAKSTPFQTEFLKATIMRSHDCAKYLRVWANFGLKNTNQEKTGTNFVYLPQFNKVFYFHMFFYVIFTHVSAQSF